MFDKNNLYIGTHAVLPLEDKSAAIVYSEYRLKQFYGTDRESNSTTNGIVTSHRKNGVYLLDKQE